MVDDTTPALPIIRNICQTSLSLGSLRYCRIYVINSRGLRVLGWCRVQGLGLSTGFRGEAGDLGFRVYEIWALLLIVCHELAFKRLWMAVD